MLTLAMTEAGGDFSPASDSDSEMKAAPRRQCLSAVQPVSSTSRNVSADSNTQRQQVASCGAVEEFVDILQVQQLLLENAGVSSDSSASVSGRGGVLAHVHRGAVAESPRLRLEAAARSRMLLEGYPAAVPTPSFRHHYPQPPPPYYYTNYIQQQQQQYQHQYQSSSADDLFSLWLGSSGTGRSVFFFYLWLVLKLI
jgi:hypothetical protein